MPYVNGQFQPAMPGTINALATGGAPPVNSGGGDAVSPQDAMMSDATGMPPGGGGLVPYNHRTGQPYGTRFGAPANPFAGIPKAPAAAKPTYATSTVPMFPDYAQFAMKRDNVDPSTVTDQQLLGYSKEYAENMLPQALMAAGHKVDAEYLKTLPHNFQYATAQSLPQLRDIINKNAPTPTTPPSSGGWMDSLRNFGADIGGGVLEGAGNALAGATRQLGDPQQQFDVAMGLVNPAYALSRLTGAPSAIPASVEKAASKITNPVANALKNAIAGTGEDISKKVSPDYQASANEPFLKPGQNFFTPEGHINVDAFNPKAFNGASLVHKIGRPIAEFAPLLATAYLTHSPAPLILGGGTMQSEQMHNQELDRINNMKPDELAKLPAYDALIKNGTPPDQAKQQVAEDSAMLQGKLGLVTGGAMGAVADIPFFKPATGALLNVIGKNFLKQAPLFGSLAAGQTALSNAAKNMATGTNTPIGQGVGEAALEGAAGALPFSLLRGHEAPGARPGGPSPSTSGAPGAAGAPQGASGGPVDVPGAVAQAFEEHPPQAFKTPEEAAQHYNDASTVFKGTLEGDGVPPDQIAAQIPAFNEAWSRATGHEVPGSAGSPAEAGQEVPTPTTPEEDAAVKAAVTTPEEELNLGEHPSEVRAATAAEAVPDGLRTRIEEDLKNALGRDPTPEEVVEHSKDVLDTALSDPKIDTTIPKNALEEAVGRLLNTKNELPEPEAVNALARKIEKEPQENVLAKKGEAAPEESGAAGNEAHEAPARLRAEEPSLEEKPVLATPEERAKLQPLEDFYKKHTDVLSALQDMSGRLKSDYLSNVVKRILANPYLKERLAQTKLSVRNPGEGAKSPTHEIVGAFRKGERGYANWGAYHPRDGVVLAGAGNKPHSALNNGLHPVTFVHEALHASLAHTIDGVLDGKITDPAIVSAVHELENFRKTLEKYGEGTTTDKDALGALKYAATDVHELVSVVNTDPRVQGILQRIKMGTINAWQKLMGIFNRMLGGTPEELPSLSRVMDLSNRLIDYRPSDFTPQGDRTFLSRQEDRVKENTPERVLEAISIKPKPKVSEEETKKSIAQNTPPTSAEALETKVFDKLKPLTHVNERLAANGKTVAPSENMDDAARVYQNLAGRASNITQQKFIAPTIGKLAEMAKGAGKSVDEFVTHLAAYYMGRRSLEVNERGELESARLKKDAEIQRDAIKERWIKGELTEGKYTEELKKIVTLKNRVSNRSPLYKAGISDQTAHALISKAKKNGISQGVIDQFEPIRKQLIEEINKNYQKSGKFSTADEARRSGLGSKWYVPLSGFGEGRADSEGTGIGAFTKEYHAAGGRETIAANPIVNLLQELQRSARDVPENTLTKTVYNFARKYGKDSGIKIRTLDVEKAIQDAHASGKGLDDIARVFKNENSIVHNAGKYRYSIEFPEDSPVLKALKEINDTPELNAAGRVLGTVSNIIARGATTLNPKFLLWNAFWRDMGYVGGQVGADLGPAALAQYMGRYWLQGGPLRGRPTYFSGLHPRNALEREAFAATGKSRFATSLSEIAKYGGDLSFEHELNKVKSSDSVYDALKKAEEGGNIKDKLGAVVRVLDQIGTSDIMTARVAAYETYKEVALAKLGKDATPEQIEQIKKDGALWSRRILDYQQRSDMSRLLNIAFPFSRVVLNQTDRLFQTFKNADGSFNYKRIATFAGVGMAAGAAYYALLRQAHPDTQKQENSTLTQNFLIPVDGKLIKIPMAYGLTRLMLVPGMMMARAAFGDSSKEDAVNEIRNAVMEGVLPFKPPEAKHNEKLWDELADIGTSLTPGAARPFVELGRNENIFGTPITPNDEYTKGPHAEAGRHATPEFWKDAAKILHTLTGGAIDAYPESLEYLTQAYGTGIGNGFIRVAAQQSRSERGQETNLQQLPFVPSITSRDAEFHTANELRNKQQDLEAKGSQNLTDQDKEDLKRMRSISVRYGKQLSAVDKNALMPPASKQKQIDSILTQKKGEQEMLLKELDARGH